MRSFDVVILGAGAAGLMCAAGAAKRGKSVLVVDHAAKVGEKIRISGGGRCNFTNRDVSPANFLSQNPHFCISALKRYTQYDFIDLVERHGIAYHEKTLGQLFCNNSAKDIISMLLVETGDTKIQTSTQISEIQLCERTPPLYRIVTDGGIFETPALVVATGGPAIPKLGATGYAYEVARQFGLRIVEPRPALVPLTFDSHTLSQLQGLSGVAVPARASAKKAFFDEALLFTHRGFSGPAILQISSYWREGDTLTIDLLPGQNALEILRNAKQTQPRKEIQTILSDILPRKLALRLSELTNCQIRIAETASKKLEQIAEHINQWRVVPNGSEGYRKAEVTLGGVDTRDLSSRTMEAVKVPGLYFIGEAVDVTGHLGGFNFQWAWASGYACGQAV